jgi:hypothetical protein
MLDYDMRGVPDVINANNKLGVFDSNLPTFGVTLYALTLGFPLSEQSMQSMSSHIIGTRSHEILLNELLGSDKQLTTQTFKTEVRAAIENKTPINVTVLISGHGTCQSFSSFIVGSSAQLYAACRKNLDIQRLVTRTNTPLRSRLANCAHCMAMFPDLAHRLAEFPHDRPLKKCGGCQSVFYCSPACQGADWVRGHDTACGIFRWLSPRMDSLREGTDAQWIDAIVQGYKRKMEKRLTGSKYVTVVLP